MSSRSGVALGTIVIAALGGCGGSDNTSGGGTQSAQSGAPEIVAMREYEFHPSGLTVKRGTTLTVENKGQIAHNLTIEKGPNPRKKSTELAGTDTFLGGKSERLSVSLEPGRYVMVCTVPGHRELGMTGTFTVTPSNRHSSASP